jgi:hypothetical protein
MDIGDFLETEKVFFQLLSVVTSTQVSILHWLSINGGHCFLPDGTMLGLINPHESHKLYYNQRRNSCNEERP